VTTRDSAKTQADSADQTVALDRLQQVLRTGWMKATAATGSGEAMQDRRQQFLVEMNQKSRKREHQGARIEVRLARRNHSCSSSM
jgi:hypothetical protein